MSKLLSPKYVNKASTGWNYVYSFLPVSGTIPSFSGDINLFLKVPCSLAPFCMCQLTRLWAVPHLQGDPPGVAIPHHARGRDGGDERLCNAIRLCIQRDHQLNSIWRATGIIETGLAGWVRRYAFCFYVYSFWSTDHVTYSFREGHGIVVIRKAYHATTFMCIQSTASKSKSDPVGFTPASVLPCAVDVDTSCALLPPAELEDDTMTSIDLAE
jgi:hypothetical protein